MLTAYWKEKNGTIHIYEKGTTYVGMIEKKVNRMFRDMNNEPLTFDNPKDAKDWCIARNEIMNIGLI